MQTALVRRAGMIHSTHDDRALILDDDLDERRLVFTTKPSCRGRLELFMVVSTKFSGVRRFIAALGLSWSRSFLLFSVLASCLCGKAEEEERKSGDESPHSREFCHGL